MADPAIGILGQVIGATANYDVYTVPAGVSATVRVFITETGGGADTYSVAVRADGAAINGKHYVAVNTAIAANDVAHTAPLQLDETDVVTVKAGANTAFTVMGIEEPKDK